MSENDKKESKITKKTTNLSSKTTKQSTSPTPKTATKSAQKDKAVIQKQANFNGEPVTISVQNPTGSNPKDGLNINLTINLANEETKKRATPTRKSSPAQKQTTPQKKPEKKPEKQPEKKRKKSNWWLWLVIVLLVLAVACAVVLPLVIHKHDYGTAYLSNDTSHWQKCTTCQATTSAEPHTFVDDKCSVCGFVKATEGLNYVFNSSGSYYEVSGIDTSSTAKHIKIPATHKNEDDNINYPVKSVGNYAFASNTTITSVTFSDNMETIGVGAFGNCDKLSSVTLSNAIKTIGMYAFYLCEVLTSITLPNGLLEIGELAFVGAELTSINIPASVETIGDNPFMWCENLTAISVDSKNTNFEIINSCLVDIVNKQIIIGLDYSNIPTNSEKVTIIGYGAFSNVAGAANLKIPSNITTIGQGAFSDCASIVSVELPVAITIQLAAFAPCSNFTTIYFAGTEAEWETINNNPGNTNIDDAARYYYSENRPTTTGNFWHNVNGVPTVWTTTGE